MKKPPTMCNNTHTHRHFNVKRPDYQGRVGRKILGMLITDKRIIFSFE